MRGQLLSSPAFNYTTMCVGVCVCVCVRHVCVSITCVCVSRVCVCVKESRFVWDGGVFV